ncbi:MAG TPA: glycosyltransferase family 2 protein [Anaeromyxobacter sp.]|nr:glycosyltransferase family 2 protein [Anaeromyxobacter sp.]
MQARVRPVATHDGTTPFEAVHEIPPSLEPPSRPRRELALTILGLAATFAASAAASWELSVRFADALAGRDHAAAAALVVLFPIAAFLVYGGAVYQLTRLGYFLRVARHEPASRDALDRLHDGDAPAVTILVPSYREDARVVAQTLLSAALQDYPSKRIVLLVDDPPDPATAEDRRALRDARALPRNLRARLLEPARRTRAQLARFEDRARAGALEPRREAVHLARLHREVAAWLEAQAASFPVRGHSDAFFVSLVLERLRRDQRARARALEAGAAGLFPLTEEALRRGYRRLAALFAAEIETFERKRWANLSHEPNKAMNLNAYLALLGRRLVERDVGGERHLVDAGEGEDPDVAVPDADYVITLDADSLLAPDYAARLVEWMERPGHERVAVAQTPYSAFPGAPGVLERVAGATTDIQRLIHQGFTYFQATYWVGANALLRKAALRDIAVVEEERGFPVMRYIQDRTVIEDTESTIDLVARGWRLHNYPDRLAFSATPPDFGSLVIQRRRWANGGLVILPKLLRHLASGRASLGEAMMRFHYLASIAAVNVGLLAVLTFPFSDAVETWLVPLTAVPYYALYLRDLRLLGYRAGDLLRVYALNLLLVPVNLAGVAKSLQQAWTRSKIPFARTPKVEGRTTASPAFVAAELALLVHWIAGAAFDLAAGRATHAAFALANAGFLLYAVGAFMGFRESAGDLLAGLRAPPAAAPLVQDELELAPALTPAGGSRL